MGKGRVMGVAGGVALAGAAVWMLKSSRAGTENAPYDVPSLPAQRGPDPALGGRLGELRPATVPRAASVDSGEGAP